MRKARTEDKGARYRDMKTDFVSLKRREWTRITCGFNKPTPTTQQEKL